ncbi:hypothetical protein GCM10010980_01390 [Corynebacterium marinum]|nr:hypothetical protein GCM10010980_01390 [Corynebacterium marinum]
MQEQGDHCGAEKKEDHGGPELAQQHLVPAFRRPFLDLVGPEIRQTGTRFFDAEPFCSGP